MKRFHCHLILSFVRCQYALGPFSVSEFRGQVIRPVAVFRTACGWLCGLVSVPSTLCG